MGNMAEPTNKILIKEISILLKLKGWEVKFRIEFRRTSLV